MPTPFHRRHPLADGLRAMACAACTLLLAGGEADPRPNIIVLFCDDLGYGDLSRYGGSDIRTPAIDALLDRGVHCVNGYVPAAICAPSRAALLTGRQPARIGITANHQSLPLGERTLADRLSAAGYATACFGKWHLGGGDKAAAEGLHPTARGFDRFAGGMGHSVNTAPAAVLADVERGLEFLREHRGRQPVFLYLAIGAPHSPWAKGDPRAIAAIDPALPAQRRTYLASVVGLDAGVARLVAGLDELNAWEGTLLFLINDNGGKLSASASNAPWRDGKYSLYEGGIHVPFAVVWQGRLPPTRHEGLVSSLDVVPTCLSAAGLPLPEDTTLDGIDLLPAFAAGGDPDRILAWQGMIQSGGPGWFAVRQGPWKLIANRNGEELYDLASDPAEAKDRSRDRPEILARMRTHMEAERRKLSRKGAAPAVSPGAGH